MNIAFFLKEPTKATETMVYVSATLKGQRLKRSTGVKVKPSQWTGTKVRQLAPESATKNLKIENTVKILKEIEREYLLKEQPLSKEILEKEFEHKITPFNTTTARKKDVLSVFNEFIDVRKQSVSENTIKTYKTCKNHLQTFSTEMKFDMSFQNITLNFYDELLAYFIEKNFYNSTIGKYVTILKTFMNWAGERRFHNNMEFKKFLVFKDDSEKIKLTPEIVEKLRTTDFEDDYSNIVRDIFIFSSYTGLRFVDIQNMRPEDVTEDFLRLHIKKAKEMLDIPLLDVPKEIIKAHTERYGRLKIPTNQFCNREIKKLFEAIGFDDKIRFVKYSGKNEITVEKNAHDYLTMHYGRVFFITNSLINGMNEEFIREITGHKDYKSFKKYVQFSREMVADSLHSAWKK
ncbi:tyrosine-type recombinase/integrase [Chryseobacterium rhizosphaerae]|uniref:tyrosine-type recombinase/integrase n=1 Tax=Chryseobacterium rhizosphaerae TaxID=395937 RepID=UPI002358B008|nr:phage integrase SAM-like domain-containing protein [Chryseobacterium rhizosphaerae]MDC8099149.1 site-specific integrase [Chryseobacterium rhizosphaerae]